MFELFIFLQNKIFYSFKKKMHDKNFDCQRHAHFTFYTVINVFPQYYIIYFVKEKKLFLQMLISLSNVTFS